MIKGNSLIPNKWDRRWIDMAQLVSTWSKDPSTQVGAVLVLDNRMLAQGWNGFPRGIEDNWNRLHDREVKYSLTVHAELNAVFNAGYNGVSLKGSTLYVYGLPVCSNCAKGIIQTGVKRIVMRFPYAKTSGTKWFEEYGKSAEMFEEVGIGHDCYDVEAEVHIRGNESGNGQAEQAR